MKNLFHDGIGVGALQRTLPQELAAERAGAIGRERVIMKRFSSLDPSDVWCMYPESFGR